MNNKNENQFTDVNEMVVANEDVVNPIESATETPKTQPTWDDFVHNEDRVLGVNRKIHAVREKMKELVSDFLRCMDSFGVSCASIEQIALLCLCHPRTLSILYKNALLGAIPNSFRRISMMRRVTQIHEGWWQHDFQLPYLDKRGCLMWGDSGKVDIMDREDQKKIQELAKRAWRKAYSHLPNPKQDVAIPARPDRDEKIRYDELAK